MPFNAEVRKFGLVLCSVILLLFAPLANAEKNVVFSAAEQEPYIGTNLPNNGYVHELVVTAYKRAGYSATINFYPPARARHLLDAGKVDGIVPANPNEKLFKHVVYSNPFPGGELGLLKRKSLTLPKYPPNTATAKIVKDLKDKPVGIVRRAMAIPEVNEANFLYIEAVNSDLQNIDKLVHNRLDLIVIDKYNAADLMVRNRPHTIGQLDFIESTLTDTTFHIGFNHKTDPILIDAFNQQLTHMKKDGSLKKLRIKHGLFTNDQKQRKRTLTIATVNNNDMKLMQKLSSYFEKQHPNVILDWRVMEEDTLRKRLLSDMAIDDGKYDIFTIGSFETPIWAEKEWLTKIGPFPPNYDIDDILSPIRSSLSHKGSLYALPFYGESSMTYYRKDLFEKAQLIMPEQPSYDDIKRFAKKLHHPDEGIFGICLRGQAGWGANMAYFNTLINTFGGRWFDEEWNSALLEPAWKQALTFYSELGRNYTPPNVSENNYNENLQLFAEGHCALWIDATVAAGTLFDPTQSKVYDQIGYAQAPIAITQKGSHWLWAWALAIPESSDNKTLAQDFILWATSRDYIELVAKHEGWIAVPSGTRRSTYQDPMYQREAPFSSFVLTAIETANQTDNTLKPSPYNGIQYVGIPEYPSMGHRIAISIQRALKQEISVDEALREANLLVHKQMKDSHYTK